MQLLIVALTIVLFACGGSRGSRPQQRKDQVPEASESTSGATRLSLETDQQECAGEPGPDEEDGGAARAPVHRSESGGDFSSHVAELRSHTRELREARWFKARSAATNALRSLAAALDTLPEHVGVRDELARLRAEAERLRCSPDSTFDGPMFIRLGLDASLSALQKLVQQCELPAERIQPWLDTARGAVDSIDDHLMTFERAALQDAFRTVSDAFTVAAQSESRCGLSANAT